MPVIAPRSPSDCFDAALEAARIAADLPHAGDPAVRRLPGQRLRAVAAARRSRTCPTCGDVRHRAERATDGRRSWPYLRDPRDAGPAVGGAGHARAGAPHRRPGEGRRDRRHLLRPGQPRLHGPAARRPRSTASRCPTSRSTTPTATPRVLVLGWGSTYGPIGAACRGGCGSAGQPVAQAHLRHLNPLPGQPRRGAAAATTRSLVPEMNLGQLALLLRGPLPASTRRATTRSAGCRSRPPSCRTCSWTYESGVHA